MRTRTFPQGWDTGRTLAVVDVTVVIPAHNEAEYLPAGLAAVRAAAARLDSPVEVVVVANRCTDRTGELAMAGGATVVEHGARCIAAVRNAGVAVATGDVVVTVDADCTMHPDTLRQVVEHLDTGRFVGGGTKVVPERRSVGISATYAVMEVLVAAARVGGGVFWTRRDDFDAVGGFDEHLVVGEDVDFARRLAAHGRTTGRKFTTLRSVPLTASCRKFDRYGDWHMFAMARELPSVLRSVRGTDTGFVDKYFHDFNG